MGVHLTSRSLRSEIRTVGELSSAEVELMRALFLKHFRSAARFREDLMEKCRAILLWEGEELVGFSSLGLVKWPSLGTVYYSGDTIVEARARGNFGLAQAWAGHVFERAAREPEQKHWWFLISSGYRTYRYLPTFFQEFYPRYDAVTPERLQEALDALGEQLYPGRYRGGVIRMSCPTALRRPETPEGRLKDKHVQFFLRANPGHATGEELACLTEIHPDNLTRAGRRMVF